MGWLQVTYLYIESHIGCRWYLIHRKWSPLTDWIQFDTTILNTNMSKRNSKDRSRIIQLPSNMFSLTNPMNHCCGLLLLLFSLDWFFALSGKYAAIIAGSIPPNQRPLILTHPDLRNLPTALAPQDHFRGIWKDININSHKKPGFPHGFCHGHLQFEGKDAPKPTPTHSAHLGLHDSEPPHRHFSAQARAKRRAALFCWEKTASGWLSWIS